MNHERRTNKLTACSDSILGKFDRRNFRAAHMRLLLSDGRLSETNWENYYPRTLVDPLFSTKPEMVYEMDALYGRLVDYFSLGPEIVRAFIERHADSYITHSVAKAYGKQGERFPTTYSFRKTEQHHVMSFLILVDVMDVLALSGPTNPEIRYNYCRRFNGGNRVVWGFAGWLALEIQQSVQREAKVAAQEEQLRKWEEEQSRKVQQLSKAGATDRMYDDGVGEAE
ncbi:uncharacterized protein BKA55DRAFT_543677 [Fusarium redolens]|uniref:Uncharacterized protein n=1 Tax=Fusarium redolens TaxID=48865 RepID=A0A9P9JTB3_FUSRE|nr:uncharacterized protein BKA55DRAFT_543677 [Fusarium redolens]KAH7237042.1 hypothetical protein BKA55DRAFT_543677 [Fusarium redolens]